MPKLNFKVRESSGFEVWPKGSYDVRLMKVEQRVSKQQNPQLGIGIECIEGPYEGKKRTWFITISDKGGFELGPLLEAAIPGQYDVEQAEPDSEGNKKLSYTFDPDDLLDKIITVDVTVREDQNGNPQNNFRARAYQVGGVAIAGGGDAPTDTNEGELVQDAPPQERQATQRRRVANA